MIEIDGSQGEGGGQILRSSLTLSILTAQPLRISNIRAHRSKPGLRAQHLKAVDAAAAISKADVKGATLGSNELLFSPVGIRTGRYRFDIGTAGSTSLVLQTIFLPLSSCRSASSVIITGGTHVPWAPCTHYLTLQWLPTLQQIGFNASLKLDTAGFYPQGGGRISATIRPASRIKPINLTERGNLVSISGISAVANLNMGIAGRQKRHAILRLQKMTPNLKIKTIQLKSKFKGTFLLLRGEFRQPSSQSDKNNILDNLANCCYVALGELGKPAERVADEAVDSLIEFLDSNAVVDQYLADQLLLPLSFSSGSSEFLTSTITSHLITNADIIQTFTQSKIEIIGEINQPGLVRVIPPINQPLFDE